MVNTLGFALVFFSVFLLIMFSCESNVPSQSSALPCAAEYQQFQDLNGLGELLELQFERADMARDLAQATKIIQLQKKNMREMEQAKDNLGLCMRREGLLEGEGNG